MGVDRIVCAGDVASFGPEPNESVQFLKETGIATARGNEDEAMARQPGQPPPDSARAIQIEEIESWSRDQLSSANTRWLAGLPGSVTGAHGFLCVHAAPGKPTAIVGPESEKPFPADITCVCAGHLHQPFVSQALGRVWSNAGSLARPMDHDPRGSLAVADYRSSGWSVSIHRIELPLEAMCRRIREAQMPYAARLCETQIKACRW